MLINNTCLSGANYMSLYHFKMNSYHLVPRTIIARLSRMHKTCS